MDNAHETPIDRAFHQYLELVNRTLEHNPEHSSTIALQLWEMSLGEGDRVAAAVTTPKAEQPRRWYGLELDAGTFSLVDDAPEGAALTWQLDEDHISRTLAKPAQVLLEPDELELPQRLHEPAGPGPAGSSSDGSEPASAGTVK